MDGISWQNLWWRSVGIPNLDLAYIGDHREGLLVATNIYGVLMPFIFLIKGYVAPSQSKSINARGLLNNTIHQVNIGQGCNT